MKACWENLGPDPPRKPSPLPWGRPSTNWQAGVFFQAWFMKTLRLWLSNRKRLHSKPHTVASFNRQTFDFHSVKYFWGLLLLETCVGDADVNVAIRDSCDDWQRRPPTGHRNHRPHQPLEMCRPTCTAHIAACVWFQPPERFLPGPAVTSLILSQEGSEMSVISKGGRLESQIPVVTHSPLAETAVHVRACAHAHSDKFAAISNWAKREMRTTHHSLGATY